MRAFVFAAAPLLASAYTLPSASLGRASTRAAVSMFFESQKDPSATTATTDFQIQTRKTHASELVTERTGCSVVVTEGTGGFYASRTLIQMLHDYGNHKSIVAHSDSVATTKKALLTRQARYSGLIDTLGFSEGELKGADAWLAINADEAALPEQIEAAKAAGVKRMLLLLTAEGPTPCPTDSAAMELMLGASGIAYTVMRTGNLVEGGESGGGLRLGEVDMAVCGDVSKEDVFRFAAEALTLPEAEGRLFSLCPSEETKDSLKQMRLCGFERRDEVQALLKGLIVPPVAEEELTEAEAEEQAELVLRSEAELAAEREEELKALLARARERGIATAAKMKYEEEEKARKREEMSKYYQAPSDSDDGATDAAAALEEQLKNAESPDAPKEPEA